MKFHCIYSNVQVGNKCIPINLYKQNRREKLFIKFSDYVSQKIADLFSLHREKSLENYFHILTKNTHFERNLSEIVPWFFPSAWKAMMNNVPCDGCEIYMAWFEYSKVVNELYSRTHTGEDHAKMVRTNLYFSLNDYLFVKMGKLFFSILQKKGKNTDLFSTFYHDFYPVHTIHTSVSEKVW